MTEQAYWNGQPVKARRVILKVGKTTKPTSWCYLLDGHERKAVEVSPEGCPVFFLDNEDENAWLKVTKGLGSPRWGHKVLPHTSVVLREDPLAEIKTVNIQSKATAPYMAGFIGQLTGVLTNLISELDIQMPAGLTETEFRLREHLRDLVTEWQIINHG